MFQSRPAPLILFADRALSPAGRRVLGLALAMAIESLLVLLLLTLGWERRPEVEKQVPTVITFIAPEAPEQSPEPPRASPEPEQRPVTRPQPQQPPAPEQPAPEQPAEPAAPSIAPPAPAIVPMRWSLVPGIPRPPAAPPARPVYGPPDVRSAAMRDTERVGTAPNGQPLYAASWYREPEHAMMRAYLSSARGPGYGLIACRTVEDFRVEDCVGLEEYPQGSNIMRSALAAAWEFRVRPPRRGGQVLVGSWVRIRISYN